MILFTMNYYPADAQVQNGSFNLMLKLLLSKSTPAVNANNAAMAQRDHIFLDAREYNEYTTSHIQHARYIGDKKFKLQDISDIKKDAAIIVYCSVGKRSEAITLQLKKAGYQHVRNLYGGIFEWLNMGYPVYNNENVITDTVHAYSRFWGKWLEKGTRVYE